jgi:hypothetical protein
MKGKTSHDGFFIFGQEYSSETFVTRALLSSNSTRRPNTNHADGFARESAESPNSVRKNEDFLGTTNPLLTLQSIKNQEKLN